MTVKDGRAVHYLLDGPVDKVDGERQIAAFETLERALWIQPPYLFTTNASTSIAARAPALTSIVCGPEVAQCFETTICAPAEVLR